MIDGEGSFSNAGWGGDDPYERRQAEPLFRNAKTMISPDEIKARDKDFQCKNWPACKVPKKSRNLFYCAICYCIMSIGQEFFDREKQIDENEAFLMNETQRNEIFRLSDYWNHWLKGSITGTMSSIARDKEQ